MTAEIINLRKVRKDREREQKAQRAAENRRKFGMSHAERDRIEAEKSRASRELDAARREPSSGDDSEGD